jgi:hypothetical protein
MSIYTLVEGQLLNQMTIRYADGSGTEGRILSLAGGSMRVALEDCHDATEFTLIGGRWISEDLQPVLFEFSPELTVRGISPDYTGATSTRLLRCGKAGSRR